MRERLFSNFNWLFADKVLRLAGGLFIGIWVARYLGPEQFGLLNYAVAFVAMFGTVSKLGMDQIVIRDMTKKPECQSIILGTVLRIKFVASVIAILLILPIAWIVANGNLSLEILIAIISIGLIFNALDAYDLYYQAHLLSRYVVIARSMSFILFSIIRVMLIVGGYPVVYFAAAATLEIAVGAIILVGIYQNKKVTESKWRFSKEMMMSLLKDGWPLIASSVLIVIHTRIDQVMIGQMLGNVDVGIYSASMRLSDSWLFVPSIIVQTMTPYLIKLRENEPSYYQARLLQLYSIMFWFGVLVGFLTIQFGEFFIVLLFGEQYQAAYLPLIVTIWTGIFISQSVARSIWLVGENIQVYRLINNLISVPMNITLNWMFIPVYGVIGASMASFISIGFGTWILPFLFKSMRASNTHMLISVNPKYLFVRN